MRQNYNRIHYSFPGANLCIHQWNVCREPRARVQARLLRLPSTFGWSLRPGRRKFSVAAAGWTAPRRCGTGRSQHEDQLDGMPLRAVSRQSIVNEHEGQ